ncbi:BON domain-containing protein [Achromobacter denitrificans]
MKHDPKYAPRYDADDYDRDPGHEASGGGPYRQAPRRGPGLQPERGRGPRDSAAASGREPWRDPAPSYGYQGEGARAPGARATRAGVRSRSADPGQSSYGGFSHEDPSFQRQQVYGARDPSYSGPTSFGDEEGGYYGDRPVWDEEADLSFETAERGGYNRGLQAWRDRGSRRVDPKGYVRTDERVREIVCEYLAHSGLDVSDVSVSVAEGCVTLEGSVPDRRSKHRIEDSADACPGVRDVDNRIRIAPPAAGRKDGAES